MNLFSKEKEIIFKITNAVLLIWAIAATVIFFSSIINLVVKEPGRNYTYNEYYNLNCTGTYYKDYNLTNEEIATNCNNDYLNTKTSNESSDYYKKITLYTSLANIVIVSGVLFFLNKPRKTIKK